MKTVVEYIAAAPKASEAVSCGIVGYKLAGKAYGLVTKMVKARVAEIENPR